jgi:hypothetical protein
MILAAVVPRMGSVKSQPTWMTTLVIYVVSSALAVSKGNTTRKDVSQDLAHRLSQIRRRSGSVRRRL